MADPKKSPKTTSAPEAKGGSAVNKVRIATAWFDACAGCHMSVLDIDERILAIVDKIDIVYGPLVDAHEFPENVDVAIIEGAISTDEDEHKIKEIRSKSKFLIALGDCAVTANVPGMRNQFTVKEILDRGYIENATAQQQHPYKDIPKLLTRARPLHEFVSVDLFVPGCPPPADGIFFVLAELLAGRIPDLTGKSRFGL
ncbi:MAG: coenzyme hydrogenase gamma subunit [Nitrospirae bacterium]|nr:MAG: coenzyme hydrogenase gamma subunit [Nitrospirota bacterium]